MIAGALITTRGSDDPAQKNQPERRICLHERGVISKRTVRIVGPGGFEENFNTGEIWLPIQSRELKYEVYERDSGKRLGRITNPSGSDDAVIVIDMETESVRWLPVGHSIIPVNTN